MFALKENNTFIDWCLVKFDEDDVILACPKAKTKTTEGVLLARWPSDGKWYPATLLECGGK